MLTELNYQDSIQGPVPKASQKLKGRGNVVAPAVMLSHHTYKGSSSGKRRSDVRQEPVSDETTLTYERYLEE